MPKRGDPQGTDRIEVAATVNIDELSALSALHDDGRVALICRHLCEPVPHHCGITLYPCSGKVGDVFLVVKHV
ncbi:unannotated protein [freshwater metagenome]|uniref:Unannotated protein n=1 Tax=freshwater metagenome TaxID=449393 RepID=A0A6J7P5Z6_9ZZZZ